MYLSLYTVKTLYPLNRFYLTRKTVKKKLILDVTKILCLRFTYDCGGRAFDRSSNILISY